MNDVKMSEELKPCPFCGGKADYDWGSANDIGGVSHQNGWVNCSSSNCDASIDVDSIDDNISDKELIDKWNKRAGDRLQQENAELSAALEIMVLQFESEHNCEYELKVIKLAKDLLNKND